MLVSSGAMATNITLPFGPIRFSFSPALTSATLAYSSGCGAASGTVANGQACDAASPAPGTPGYAPGSLLLANGVREDSWGIGAVSALSTGGSTFWNPGGSGEYIEFMYGGVWDHWVVPGLISTNTFSSGGFVEIWSHAAATIPVNPNPNARTGLTTYPGVTTGELLLSLSFAMGCDSTFDPSATLCGSFNNGSFGGGSTALFDVTGGTWKDYFDTNTQLAGSDFLGAISYSCGTSGGCNPANPVGTPVFSLVMDGSIQGFASPVVSPAPLILMVPGLLALGAGARRRRASTRR
jgi:hypothetical protein